MKRMLFGTYDDRTRADKAYGDFEREGFKTDEFSFVTKETAEGAVGGAATGGVIGGIAGLLASAGVLPVLGGLLIGGPITAALGLTGAAAAAASGAAAGAMGGGLIGALTKFGLSEADAKYYNDSVENGGMLFGVPVDDETEPKARKIFTDSQAGEIRHVDMK